MATRERGEAVADANVSHVQDFREALCVEEGELLRELVSALRTIRYGSIVLTLHDGRIVEIQKTERIRRHGGKEYSARASHK